jgi:hypothetical protein
LRPPLAGGGRPPRTGVGDGQDDGFDELLNLLVETANRAVRVSGLRVRSGSGGGCECERAAEGE